MPGGHKPRSGSLAVYPRKRAKKETPSFNTFPHTAGDVVKPLNFLAYKAGMLHMIARNEAKNTATSGHDIFIPGTVLECPAMKVYGIRAYRKSDRYGTQVLTDVLAAKVDKELLRKVKNIKHKRSKKKKDQKESDKTDFSIIESQIPQVVDIKLLCHTQPSMTGTEKKTPDIVEVAISGSPEKQLAYAKEKLGKELSISEVFKEKQFVDIKAVTKGKGFQGVVKRFGIKMHRPKAKKRRIVGSIGPWNPSTVMWTVARAGQMGYHTRTEFNKRILYLGNNPADVNPGGGFNNYGDVKSTYIILSGSTAGPEKRAVALRDTMRKPHDKKYQISGILYLSTKKGLSEETKKKEAEKIKEAAEQAAAEEAAARAGMPAPPKKTKRH